MYIYFLQSISNAKQTYIGLTFDIATRIKQHYDGSSSHTSKYRPWKLIACIWMDDAIKAENLEAYMKTGSGRAFFKRHF